jgi:hypothetical protein
MMIITVKAGKYPKQPAESDRAKHFVIFYERNKAHPDGVAFVDSSKAAQVARTPKVQAAINEGKLIVVKEDATIEEKLIVVKEDAPTEAQPQATKGTKRAKDK